MSFYCVNGVAKKLLKELSDTKARNSRVQWFPIRQLRNSVYINDLPLCTDMFNMIMYADDTTLFCDINSIPDVEHSLQGRQTGGGGCGGLNPP